MRAFFVLLVSLLLVGCGYKSVSTYTKKTIGDSVYVFVEIYASDPENSVVIKDAVNEAVITKFRSKLTTIEKATTKMAVKITSVSLSPIQYDSSGYVVLYRMSISLNANVSSSGRSDITAVTGRGSYDFSIEPGSSLPEEKRFSAIKESASKALDMLISQIAVKGALQ